MRAVRGGGAGGLGSSGAGQDGTRTPCAPCRSFPGIIKYFLRPGRRCNHIWICDSRALACWLRNLVGNPRSNQSDTERCRVQRRGERADARPQSRLEDVEWTVLTTQMPVGLQYEDPSPQPSVDSYLPSTVHHSAAVHRTFPRRRQLATVFLLGAPIPRPN